MDVGSENFGSVLELLKQQIPICDFVSIDCEFTGLDDASAIPGSSKGESNIAVDFETGPEEAQHR